MKFDRFFSTLVLMLMSFSAQGAPVAEEARQIFREIEQEIDAPSFVHEEGVDLGPLSPEGIEKFVEFATNAKRESVVLLEDLVQTRKRSDKIKTLIDGMRGIVTRNYPRESGLQLRIAHNRGVALVERVIHPASLGLDRSGTVQLELAVLVESVRLAIAEYEPDLKYRDALKSFHESKGAEPTPDRARFGLEYTQALWTLKERHILSPIQDYALSLALMELLQWDLAKDKKNEAYSSSIVELYCQIPKKEQSRHCSQKLNPFPEQVSERQARSLLPKLQTSMNRALSEALAVRNEFKRQEDYGDLIRSGSFAVAHQEFEILIVGLSGMTCGYDGYGIVPDRVGKGSDIEITDIEGTSAVKILRNTLPQGETGRAVEGCVALADQSMLTRYKGEEPKPREVKQENIRIIRPHLPMDYVFLQEGEEKCNGGKKGLPLHLVAKDSEVEILGPEVRNNIPSYGGVPYIQVRVIRNSLETGVPTGCIGWIEQEDLKTAEELKVAPPKKKSSKKKGKRF